MESYSHALVHFKEDNAIEIVKIGNVMTFNVETDSAKLDTDCLHEVRFDGEVYAARVMALGNSEEALIPRRTRAINYKPLSSPEPGAKRMRKLKRPYSPTQQSDDNSEGETTAKKDLSVRVKRKMLKTVQQKATDSLMKTVLSKRDKTEKCSRAKKVHHGHVLY
ncbi:hypothetical protein LSAT2_013320 [Lamellibrachia satsuma]|nr:hypothetical protein LSAT2_013320 [Lamellibrachia satsuma]